MKWLWIRHGETKMNRQKRYVGHSDVPLSEQGQREAEELAKRWAPANEGAVRIYSSDLRRCIETARPLAAAWGVPIAAVPALRELSFGTWELFTYEQLMEEDGERATRWYDDPFTSAPPDGESLRQLGERFDPWLRSVLAELKKSRSATREHRGAMLQDGGKHESGSAHEPASTADDALPELIAVVTHGGVIRWFQAAWLAQDPGRYWQAEGLQHGEALLVDWDGQRWAAQSVTK